MSDPKVTFTVGRTLRPISSTFRARIKASFAVATGGSVKRLNDETRIVLEKCIFDEQNELEHKQPRHPQVEVMNAVRNVLLDDVPVEKGGNEVHRRRDPRVYGAASAMYHVIARGGGPSDGLRIGTAKVLFLTGRFASFSDALQSLPVAPTNTDSSEDEEAGDDDAP